MDAVGWLGNRQRYKLPIKAKNKQANSFYIKIQGILAKPEVYSERSETSKKSSTWDTVVYALFPLVDSNGMCTFFKCPSTLNLSEGLKLKNF